MNNICPLYPGRGNEAFNGVEPTMEARLPKPEASIECAQRDVSEIKADIRCINDAIDSDFKLTFDGLIFVALGLAGIMARGFGRL